MKCLLCRLCALIILLNVTACKSIDLAQSVGYNNFKDACFELNLDSYLYTHNYCDSESKCFGIQSYGLQNSRINEKTRFIPNSQLELESNLKKWNKIITETDTIGGLKSSKYVGTVKKSDKLKIKKIEYESIFSYGSLWRVQATIISGEHKGKTVQIPDMFYLQAPTWLKHSSFKDGPVVDEKFLSICQ